MLDAHMNVDMGVMLGDVSMNSIAAPTPVPAARQMTRKDDEKPKVDPALVPLPSPAPSPSPSPLMELDEEPIEDDSAGEVSVDLGDSDEGDETVILEKPSPPSPPPRAKTPPAAPSTPPRELMIPGLSASVTPGPGVTATPGTARKGRVKITTDVERIVVCFIALLQLIIFY